MAPSVKVEDLRPADCVFLHALLAAEGDGGAFMRASPATVAPSDTFYWHLVAFLERQGILFKPIDAQMAAGASRYRGPRLPRHELVDGFPRPGELKAEIELRLKGFRKQRWATLIYADLWEELALAELEAYVEWELASHRFEPQWCTSLMPAFGEGLAHYSIGQMFYFCWTTVRDLASHHLRYPAPFETYKAYLLGTLQSKVRRAHKEGWEIRQYSRQWRRPRNALANTFAGPATELGERYLVQVPSAEALSSLF